MNEREVGKIEKYKKVKGKIARVWGMKKVTVIPLVVRGLGATSTGFKKYVTTIGIEMKAEHAQKQPYWGQQGF